MAKKQKLLGELFHDALKDIYFAEKKILATLPKIEKAAQSSGLAAVLGKSLLQIRCKPKTRAANRFEF